MGPPRDDPDRGPYDHSTEVNTDPKWMNGKNGQPILGDGVKANLDDLTGYSTNLNQIQTNFMGLSQRLTSPLHDMTNDAFPGGAGNGLVWTADFLGMSQHNIGQLETFFGYLSIGIRNVAMAAQAVANAYGGADETAAANMNAVDFAFGDLSKSTPGIPAFVRNQLTTWDKFAAAHPEQSVVIPDTGLPPGAVAISSPDPNKRIVEVTLPDGRKMRTETTTWGYYGATGQTQTVLIDGKEVSSVQTTSYGGKTQTVETQTTYDEKSGKARTQVTGRTDETVTSGPGGSTQTDRTVTTYTYDDHGKQTGSSTTTESTSVGSDNPIQPGATPQDDPAFKREQELMPETPKTQILAPGPLDGSAPASGSGTTSV